MVRQCKGGDGIYTDNDKKFLADLQYPKRPHDLSGIFHRHRKLFTALNSSGLYAEEMITDFLRALTEFSQSQRCRNRCSIHKWKVRPTARQRIHSGLERANDQFAPGTSRYYKNYSSRFRYCSNATESETGIFLKPSYTRGGA